MACLLGVSLFAVFPSAAACSVLLCPLVFFEKQTPQRTRPRLIFAASVVLGLSILPLSAADAPSYEEHIKPLFIEKCAACHGALKQEADLRLDAIQLTRAGTESGPVIVPGASAKSSLFERVAASDLDLRMPPEGEGEALDADQLELVRRWIDAGAVGPDTEPVPSNPEEHWAYQQPVQAQLPNDDEHPVDAFLLQLHRERGVTPLDNADPFTLLRRLTVDLTGLPPTRAAMESFAADRSPDAFERAVDRMLASTGYGERWARHWMDVWRYSDWDGYKQQLRGSQRHVWRWRDWIIESLNDDVGYDQMIREMLAGDEMAPADLDTLRATGFLARNYHKSNRNIWLDATVEHTAKAFLGTTINCARCHDHKFDPIAQIDYYAMRAIFEPHHVRIERLPGEEDTSKVGLVRAYDAKPNEATYLYRAGNEKHPDKDHPVSPGLPAVLGEWPSVEESELPLSAWLPGARDWVRPEDVGVRERRVEQARKTLDAILAKKPADAATETVGTSGRPPAPPLPVRMSPEEQTARAALTNATASLASRRARWAADEAKHLGSDEKEATALAKTAALAQRIAKLRAAELDHLQKFLAWKQAKAETDTAKRTAAVKKTTDQLKAATKTLSQAQTEAQKGDAKYPPIMTAYPRTTTGRRSAFANWVANRNNPLTARVAVNHVWLRLIGEPLVANVFDFGLRSPKPEHAELLDWLAVDFMEHGWSLKHLVRQIVTSAAYRRASSVSPRDAAATATRLANEAVDPDNTMFWRGNVRRLDAEVVRDAVLNVSGSLDRTVGGPEIPYRDGEKVLRRSVYIQHAYEKQMTMLVLFDAANPTDCYRRSESVIPQQALALTNSGLALSEARKLAGTLWNEAKGTDDAELQFILIAFHQVLSRGVTENEIDACREFLASQEVMLAQPDRLKSFASKTKASTPASTDAAMRARENLVHVLMNHNDFVTLR